MSLERETEGAESAKLICLGRTQINNHYDKIEIPAGANLLRTKKGHVIFYDGQKPEGSKNGWSAIPGNVNTVEFPEYRERSGVYGKPKFYST